MQETPVQFLGQTIPWRRDRLPTPVFLVKESLGLGKETTVSNYLTSGKTKRTLSPPWCSRPVASTWDLSPPAQNLPPPVQLQMPSQLKITQNVLPD